MLKANIDKNENACKIEFVGSSLELVSDLCIVIENFTNCLMTKHSKDETLKFVTTACSIGIAHALKDE